MLRGVLRSIACVGSIVIGSIVIAALGCGDGAAAPREEPIAQPAPAAEPVSPPRSPSADGLEVRRTDDGRISIAATDRTGRPLAITYEDATYLESALPTLERSLSAPQIDALRRVVAEER